MREAAAPCSGKVTCTMDYTVQCVVHASQVLLAKQYGMRYLHDVQTVHWPGQPVFGAC